MTGIYKHLESGATTVCHAWAITRADGTVFGFTDHDTDLAFEGFLFKANSGLTAKALQQTTGLSVDNSEAMGALSDLSVTEADLLAGRFDSAGLCGWLVNWANPDDRILQFRGTLGEVVRSGGAFQAEMRGLTELLNQPQGRVFQRSCPAVLGDQKCRFDLGQAGFSVEAVAGGVQDKRVFYFEDLSNYAHRWFERGRIVVLSGAAKGLIGIIKNDHLAAGGRVVELWQPLGPEIGAGDLIRLEAGCDKQAETCRVKFANFVNFRGFPDIPGEDWLTSYPVSAGLNEGGSLVR